MASIRATSGIRWLALGLLPAMTFIGIACAGSGTPVAGSAAGPKAAIALPEPDTGAGADEIRSMIAKYAKSIDAADTDLASQIWSTSSEVSFIHPLGHEHSLDEIKQHVYRHLMGETFSERELSPHDIDIHVYDDAAWAEFYWDFHAKYRKNGTPVTTHGRETQIYRKEQGGWRLVHVHYSAMPVAQQANGF